MNTQFSDKLGTVSLTISRATISRVTTDPAPVNSQQYENSLLGEPKIHEQAKKAIDHKVQ